MTRMAHAVNTLSTLMRAKNISKLAAVCVIGRITYCTLGDAKADDQLAKSLREDPPFSYMDNYRQLLDSGRSLQRCRVALTRSQDNSVSHSIESCSRAQNILTDTVRSDEFNGTVDMAISKRNLFSTQTKKIFHGKNMSAEDASVAVSIAR